MAFFLRHVLVCTNEKPGHCGELGGFGLLEAFRTQVKLAGLENQVLVSKTGCTKQHHLGAAVIVHPDGVWYKGVSVADVPELVESHLKKGIVVARLQNKEK